MLHFVQLIIFVKLLESCIFKLKRPFQLIIIRDPDKFLPRFHIQIPVYSNNCFSANKNCIGDPIQWHHRSPFEDRWENGKWVHIFLNILFNSHLDVCCHFQLTLHELQQELFNFIFCISDNFQCRSGQFLLWWLW